MKKPPDCDEVRNVAGNRQNCLKLKEQERSDKNLYNCFLKNFEWKDIRKGI